MSYGSRRYGSDRYSRGGDYYQPSPWASGRAPERYGDRYGSSRYSDSRHSSSLDSETQLAAANAILNAVLSTQVGGSSRGSMSFKRSRYDDRFGRDRRDSYRSSTRTPYRGRMSTRGKSYRGSSKPVGRRSHEDSKGNDKESGKDGEEKEDKAEGEKTEGATEKKKEEWKEWKYRCHLCWKHMDTEEEHLEHLKTDGHQEKLEERRTRYRRQIQAIVNKLRRQEETGEMRGLRNRNFCTVCNVNFFGLQGRHNTGPLHKDMRNLKQAYCRFCDVRFNDRIDYDKHILTIKHLKIRLKKLSQEDQLKPEDMEVLDSVGDEDDAEEDLEHPEEWNGEQALGMQCVRKVVGYFCKLCCKFFTEEEQTLDAHCKGETHYLKFVEYAKAKLEEIAKKKEEKAKEEAKKKEEEEAAAAAAAAAAAEENENVEEEGKEEEDEEMETAATEDAEMEEPVDAEKAEETKEEEEAAVEEEVAEEEEEEEAAPAPKKTPTRGRGRGRGRKKT